MWVLIMKLNSLLMFFLLLAPSVYSETEQTNKYSFTIESVNPKSGYVWFRYRNESTVAHCVRSEDLELNLIGDSLYLYSEKNIPIKYKGYMGDATLSLTPKKFILIPPGEEMLSSIYLNEHYSLKKENILVSYSIPVIPCEVVMERYVNVPPTVYLKDKINDPFIKDTSVFAVDYPEWSTYGFIAVSERLFIKRK